VAAKYGSLVATSGSLWCNKIDQAGSERRSLLDPVALQFDIKPVAKQARQLVAAASGERGMIAIDRQRDRPIGPPVSAIKILGVAIQHSNLIWGTDGSASPGTPPSSAASGCGSHARAPPAARCVPVPRPARCAHGVLIAEIDRELTADDRLDAVAGHLVENSSAPNMCRCRSAPAPAASAFASSPSFWILIDPFSSE